MKDLGVTFSLNLRNEQAKPPVYTGGLYWWSCFWLAKKQGHKKLQELDAQDHHRYYSRRPQSPRGRASPVIADHHPPQQQPPRSPDDWPWNNNNGYRSSVTKSPAPPLSPWSAADADRCVSNAMTGSMTTTCCSSTGSGSGAEVHWSSAHWFVVAVHSDRNSSPRPRCRRRDVLGFFFRFSATPHPSPWIYKFVQL